MKNHSLRKGKAAFTLIELMAVITIIVILAGLVVGGMGYVNEKQANSKAKVQIALLSKALEEYKLDMGRYPGTSDNTSADGLITWELYDQLFYQGYLYNKNGNVAADQPTKIYLVDLDPRFSKQGWLTATKNGEPTPPSNTSTKIKDPWGKEYRYRKGNNAINPEFDIWSSGKDGLTVTGTSAADMKNSKAKDDVKNF